ncbi:histamine H2 receptor-like [Oculina patagonica]
MEAVKTSKPTQITPLCNETLEMVFWILYGSAGIVILAGNLFTFLVFVTTKRLRRSYMNIFLVSLAVADIMMAVFVVPGYAVFCNGCKYDLSKHCWLMAGLKDIAFGGTVFNLAAISFDRFLAVLRPLHYHNYMTKRTVSFILVGVWVLSSIVALLRNVWLHTESEEEARKIDKIYNSTLIFAFALLPILVILVINVKIIKAIRRQNQRVRQERNSVSEARTEQDTRFERTKARKGTISCVLVVFVFLVSWLPLAFVNFSFVLGRPDLVSDVLVKIAWLLLFMQSSANPFIYSFCRSDFRQAGLALICCKFTGSRRVATTSLNDLNI